MFSLAIILVIGCYYCKFVKSLINLVTSWTNILNGMMQVVKFLNCWRELRWQCQFRDFLTWIGDLKIYLDISNLSWMCFNPLCIREWASSWPLCQVSLQPGMVKSMPILIQGRFWGNFLKKHDYIFKKGRLCWLWSLTKTSDYYVRLWIWDKDN
jgi:hypothetical protein